MKKSIAVMLIVVFLFSSLTITAYAANGPLGIVETPWGDSFYLAYVTFLETDENGNILQDEDFNPIAHTVFSEDVSVDALDGAVYDKETNTLTLTNFIADNMILETNVMGDDFVIKVVGECSIGQMRIWGDHYGGTLNLEGDGCLTVNKNSIYDNAVILNAEYSNSSLNFGQDVTVKLYAKQDVAVIRQCMYDSTDAAYSFANGATPEISKEPYSFESTTWINGYELRDFSSSMKAVSVDDPDGVYGVDLLHYVEADEDVYSIKKLIYSEKYDAYFEDEDFSREYGDEWGNYELTPEEFETSVYKIVYDEYLNAEWIENIVDNKNTRTVYVDESGNQYCIATEYTDDTKIDYAVSFELIEGLNDTYMFTREPDVDVLTLEPYYEVVVDDSVSNFTLRGKEFYYIPSEVPPTTETTPTEPTTTEPPEQKLLGDVNSDGDVNIKDAADIQLYLAKLNTGSFDESVADVNIDGEVNIKDAAHVQLQLAKLI